MCYNGTFRFKKLDDSFWNGETFRFADYICLMWVFEPCPNNFCRVYVVQTACR